MSTYFYSDAENQPIGPNSIAELKRLARSGVVTGSTPIIEHGSSTWSTWSDIETEQRPAEIAEAMVSQARQVKASLSEVAWGAALYGLLLVVLQILLLPYSVIKKSIVDLSAWGKEGHLPSSGSEIPVLTFLVVVLRPPAIIINLLWSVYWLGYSLIMGSNSFHLYDADYVYFNNTPPDAWARVEFGLSGVVLIYFYSCAIGLLFDVIYLAVSMAGNLRKIADKK